MKILAPVSIGELFDKISILQIKLEKIPEGTAYNHVMTELSELAMIRDSRIRSSADIRTLTTELSVVNRNLWNVEDDIRALDKRQVFDEEFIRAARLIYALNDQRAAIKKKINEILDSEIVEEKVFDLG